MNPKANGARSVRIERVLQAPPERVFQAWVDPGWVCRWMNSGEVVAVRAEIEPRVGGRFRLWQSLLGKDIGGAEGQFVEFVENRKLVYRWAFVGPERLEGESYDTLVTVTFSPEAKGRTRVVVIHEQLDGLRRGAPGVAELVEPSWVSCLDQLDRLLSS